MTTAADHTLHSWRAVSASRRGSSHGSDVPNQDAVRCEQVSRPEGADLWVAAVADGHGGARYVRSDVGARIAVDAAVESVRRAIDADPDADLSTLLRAQVPGILDAWRDAVRSHADAHAFTQPELARAGGDPSAGGELTAYGATLLVALVGDHGVAVAQIGDGDALVRSHGFATRPVPGDARLVAGETTSLCLASAVGDFRYAFLPASTEPDLVLLATDGYGNSFAHADWWQGLLGDVASFVERLGFQQLEEQLPDWLEESARVGGDDVSAVLVVRRPLAVEPASAAVPVPAASETGGRHRTLELPGEDEGGDAVRAARTDPDDPARRRGPAPGGRAAMIALLATVLVVLGVLAALFLLGPDDPASPVDSPSELSTSTPPAGGRTDETTDRDTGGDRKSGNRPSNHTKQRPGTPSVEKPPAPEESEQPPKPVQSSG